MSDTDGPGTDAFWPLPKFHFEVIFGEGPALHFQEVSGLDPETQPLEYRAGNNPSFSTLKMPGMLKSANVTLRKGVFTKDSGIWNWFNTIRMNTIERRSVTIRLIDETGAPTMVWHLANAFPVKVTGTDLKAEGNEVAVEAVEFAYEGITIENG